MIRRGLVQFETEKRSQRQRVRPPRNPTLGIDAFEAFRPAARESKLPGAPTSDLRVKFTAARRLGE